MKYLFLAVVMGLPLSAPAQWGILEIHQIRAEFVGQDALEFQKKIYVVRPEAPKPNAQPPKQTVKPTVGLTAGFNRRRTAEGKIVDIPYGLIVIHLRRPGVRETKDAYTATLTGDRAKGLYGLTQGDPQSNEVKIDLKNGKVTIHCQYDDKADESKRYRCEVSIAKKK